MTDILTRWAARYPPRVDPKRIAYHEERRHTLLVQAHWWDQYACGEFAGEPARLRALAAEHAAMAEEIKVSC